MFALALVILLIGGFLAVCSGPFIFYVIPFFFSSLNSILNFMFVRKHAVPPTAEEAAIRTAKNKIHVDKMEIIKQAHRDQKMSIYRKECIARMHGKIDKQIKNGNFRCSFSANEVCGEGYINDENATLLKNHFEGLGYKVEFNTTTYSDRWFNISWEQK